MIKNQLDGLISDYQYFNIILSKKVNPFDIGWNKNMKQLIYHPS